MSWLLRWEEELGKLDELLALLAKAPPSPECEKTLLRWQKLPEFERAYREARPSSCH